MSVDESDLRRAPVGSQHSHAFNVSGPVQFIQEFRVFLNRFDVREHLDPVPGPLLLCPTSGQIRLLLEDILVRHLQFGIEAGQLDTSIIGGEAPVYGGRSGITFGFQRGDTLG